MEVKIREVRTCLWRLLEHVVLPLNRGARRRLLGSAKGEFTVPDDFNDPLPKEIEDLFWK